LLHNAGYKPDPDPLYSDPAFGCKNTADYYPQEDFSCIEQVYAGFLQESLVTPPGQAYVYSDLSFITLQFIVGSVVYRNKLVPSTSLLTECANLSPTDKNLGFTYNCYFEAFVRTEVFQESAKWMPNTGYLPPATSTDACQPSINDTTWRHMLVQGHVHDPNCYAMGGVCGHAGMFSTAPDLAKMLTRLLNLAVGTQSSIIPETGREWLNSTTVQYFSTEYNHTQSSRALGWTTNDASVNDYGFSGSCGNMSAQTFMHLGYTGTCVCIDPVNKIWSVVLTNRVMNGGSSDGVKTVYRAFHNAILERIATPTA